MSARPAGTHFIVLAGGGYDVYAENEAEAIADWLGRLGIRDTSSPETRIDLAILGYAITSMEMETYRPARLILLGTDAPPELRRATSLDARVTVAAPPLFIRHTTGSCSRRG